MLFPPPQGFPKLFINNWFPSYISAKTAGNRRDGTKRLSWDLIRSIKKGLRHGQFCSFECFKIWPDCLNFKHWPILSSASGALFILPWNLPWQTVLIKTKKKRKKTDAFKRCIILSLSVKRPLIFWTRRLHLDALQSQCIHTCHTKGLIIRLPLLMIHVNRLFTAQRSVKCWFFDNVWIMT